MNYYVRVAIGLILGLALVGVSSFWVSWWLVAPIGALFSMMSFLATFFLWSADRPEEGYEQVLFDGPNVTHGLGLVILMIIAAFGGSFLGGEKTATAPPDPALVTMDTGHDTLVHVYNQIQKGELDAKGSADAQKKVLQVQTDVGALAPAPAKAKLLDTASKAIVAALLAYDGCGDKACQAATLALLEAKTPLDAYAAT